MVRVRSGGRRMLWRSRRKRKGMKGGKYEDDERECGGGSLPLPKLRY
jgi:hypothetical protein